MSLRSLALVSLLLSHVVTAAAPATPPPPPPNAPPIVPAGPPGSPLAGLTVAQLAVFQAGFTEFNNINGVADGLGPVFNGRSCGECHTTPVPGGGSNRLVTRFGKMTNGAFDPMSGLGGSLIQDHAIGTADGSLHQFTPESVPATATIVAHRRSVPVFGLGFVDATPDSVFIALAAEEAARRDGTAGRMNLVNNISAGMNTVGKFGWKDQEVSLFQFSGDAYLNEMGITNPQFPSENCPQGNCTELAFNPVPALNENIDGVQNLTNFMTMIAPLSRGRITPDVSAGERVFQTVGCDSCHVATLHTGPSPIAALNRKEYHPYSDFLLHDMGSLGDGIVQGNSTGREMRTAPLWGLRFVTMYLHDGRALTLDQAIRDHAGQGAEARQRYLGLSRPDHDRLLTFLGSL